MPAAQKLDGDKAGSRRGTLRHIVEATEGSLGWTPRPPRGKSVCMGVDRQRALNLEVTKLRTAMAKNPKLYTVEHLELALAWCHKKRLAVASPVALIYHVERALEEAVEPEPVVDVMQRRLAAIAWEKDHEDEESERWLRRLSRARGVGLTDVLDQWSHARGR